MRKVRLTLKAGGFRVSIVFVRFNPDSYKVNGVWGHEVKVEQRKAELIALLQDKGSVLYTMATIPAATMSVPTSEMATEPNKPAPPPFARFVTIDELGLLRVCEVPAGPDWGGTRITQKWGVPDKARSAMEVAVSPGSGDDAIIAVARSGGLIEILSSKDGSTLSSIPPHMMAAKGGPRLDADSIAKNSIEGLKFRKCGDEGVDRFGELISATAGGVVRIHAVKEVASTEGLAISVTQSTAFQTCSNLLCMAVDQSESRIAVGGEGCQMQVWSLDSCTEIFRAKGGKPNRVGNVDLAHVTAVAWVGNVDLAHVTAVAWLPDEPQASGSDAGKRVWVANARGDIEALDLSKGDKGGFMQGAIRGAGGSVRMLSLHPGESSLMVSAGLDRHVRVHDTSTRRGLCRVYMKQQLCSVAFLPVCTPVVESVAVVQEEEQADMGKRKRSKKSSESGVVEEEAGEVEEGAAPVVQELKKKKKKKVKAV
eukprot:gene15724-21844_t